MAYEEIPDADLAVDKPITNPLMAKFKANDEACADNPFWFESSEITHNTSVYTKIGEFPFRFPASAKVASFHAEMKVSGGTGYAKLKITGETEESGEESETNLNYQWHDFVFSDISAHAGQEKTIEIWGKLATSGTVYFRATGNMASYTGRS